MRVTERRPARTRPAAERAAFRAWARAHHPDAGGDPAEFAAGLQHWRRRAARPAGEVVLVRRGRWPLSALRRRRERRRRAGRLR
ncbi:hypothetical protein [Actinomadura macrotermitis]|uniref:J domain-containing protein n=1 Tax=Actinomadura macrotermitis TaxID=2585200 RepID=A0A7K0BZW0_9ACTN|nr:hypothetical protein [Actinomadura macrotermitis]MQY06709.1 hypothetical protein [Actinomadura macrotermitis]